MTNGKFEKMAYRINSVSEKTDEKQESMQIKM